MATLDFISNSPWDQRADCSTIRDILSHGKEVRSASMKEYLRDRREDPQFSRSVYVKELAHKGESIKVAFKVCPDLKYARFEEFASRVDELFCIPTGRRYIPPTTVREFAGDRGQSAIGSCSYFVENSAEPTGARLSSIDKTNLSALMYFYEQKDIHFGKWLAPQNAEGVQGVLIDTEAGAEHWGGIGFNRRPFAPVTAESLHPSTLVFFKHVEVPVLAELGRDLIECDPKAYDPRGGSDFFFDMKERARAMVETYVMPPRGRQRI